MTRSTLKYLALLALAIALFYWKTLLTGQFTIIIGSEGVNLTYSWLHFWVHSIWQGHVPLWDPYAFGGRPFAGEMLPSAYYPPHLLFALVPLNRNGLISPGFFHQFLVLTHILCAYFMFALLRELRCSRFAAFVGACAFSLGGLLSRMIWPMYLESCIWLPAIFLFLLRAFRADRRGRAMIEAALGGLCLGMSILTGGIGFSMMQGIFAMTAVLYYGARSHSDTAVALQAVALAGDRRASWIRAALILAMFLAVAAGTGAVQLLPAREYSPLAMRFIDGGAFPAARKIPYNRLVPGMWPQSIVSALFPIAFDGRYGGEEYFPFYIGVLPLFLAIVAIWRCWSHLWVRYLTVLAVFAFVYSLGEFSPLNGVLYAVVPFLWAARSANRFLYLVSFAMAILAAFGLDILLANANAHWWAPAKNILKWVAIACAAALFVPGIFNQINLDSWNALSLLVILAACGCFVHLTRHPAGPWLRGTLVVFILFDLSAFAWLEADKASPGKPDAELEQMISLRGAAGFVKSRPGLHRVRVTVEPQPNVGDVYGIQSIWGGGATVLTDYSRLGARDDLMNVGYYIKPASAPDPNPLYQDARWKVYEYPAGFPRAWLVHKVIVAASPDAVFRDLNDPAINLRNTAVLDVPLPRALDGEPGVAESVRFQSWEPDRMSMDVNTEKPGLLVLSEIYYPGWRASVNGKPAVIYNVDGALRGILAPQGSSRIELAYVPFSFYVGGAITLLTVICVLSGLILSWRRGRKAGAPHLRSPQPRRSFGISRMFSRRFFSSTPAAGFAHVLVIVVVAAIYRMPSISAGWYSHGIRRHNTCDVSVPLQSPVLGRRALSALARGSK